MSDPTPNGGTPADPTLNGESVASPTNSASYGTPPAAPSPYGAAPGATLAPKWNTLSIISLVASILFFHIIGIITGHIALNQIKKTGEQGKVLAIIGVVLGYLGFVIVVIITIALFAGLLAWGSVVSGY